MSQIIFTLKLTVNIPKAIIIGISIVITFYLIINFAYFYVLGFDGVQHSKLLASDLAKSFFGEKGYTITSVVIFISILGYINTAIMPNPRIYYAMADDKILPEIFKRVNSKTMTQAFALSFFVAVMLISLFFLDTFEESRIVRRRVLHVAFRMRARRIVRHDVHVALADDVAAEILVEVHGSLQCHAEIA